MRCQQLIVPAIIAAAAFVIPMAVPMEVAAQPLRLNGLQAGAEAFQRGEALRRDAFNRQLGLNEALRQNAIDRAFAGYNVPSVFYYRPYTPTWSPIGGTLAVNPYAYGSYGPYGPVFNPGTVHDYYYGPRWDQPIGRVEVQTGPRRWESRPIYSGDYVSPGVVTDQPRIYKEKRERPKPRVIETFPEKKNEF